MFRTKQFLSPENCPVMTVDYLPVLRMEGRVKLPQRRRTKHRVKERKVTALKVREIMQEGKNR